MQVLQEKPDEHLWYCDQNTSDAALQKQIHVPWKYFIDLIKQDKAYGTVQAHKGVAVAPE